MKNLFTKKEYRTVIFWGAGLLGGGVAAYYIDKGLTNYKTARFESNAFDPTKSAYYAQRLFSLVNTPWYQDTDEEAIYQTIASIGTKKMWAETNRIYVSQYGKSLSSDMIAELSNEEYAKVIQIVNTLS